METGYGTSKRSVFGSTYAEFKKSPFKKESACCKKDIRVERKCVMKIDAGLFNTMTLSDKEWVELRHSIRKIDQLVAAVHLEKEEAGLYIEFRPSPALAVRVSKFDEICYQILKGSGNFDDSQVDMIDMNQEKWNELRILTA
jgi:hypothetical protein